MLTSLWMTIHVCVCVCVCVWSSIVSLFIAINSNLYSNIILWIWFIFHPDISFINKIILW